MPDDARDAEILRLRERVHKLVSDVVVLMQTRRDHRIRISRLEDHVEGMMKADEMQTMLREHDEKARRVRLNVAQKALLLLIALVPLATLVWTILLHYGVA